MSETPQSQSAPATPRELQSGLRGLLYRIRANYLPEIHRFEGEEDQLVIRMAPYRKVIPFIGFKVSAALMVAAAVFGVFELIVAPELPLGTIAIALALAALVITLEFARELLIYYQWQFILTNRRLILITPDPDKFGYADAIYLKSKIQVMDTNWSKSPFWGFFQALYGSRDVVLSLSGYEFAEKGARVKGGLRFPDVMPEDILKLEKLIFG